MKGNIIFIDETAGFYKTQRFAERVRGSDYYFVIVTRDDLPQLPYSVDEIYGLRNVSDTSKYKEFKKVYNEAYKIYLPKPIRMYSDTPSDDISEAVTIHSSIGTKEDNEHQGFELTDSSRVLSS